VLAAEAVVAVVAAVVVAVPEVLGVAALEAAVLGVAALEASALVQAVAVLEPVVRVPVLARARVVRLEQRAPPVGPRRQALRRRPGPVPAAWAMPGSDCGDATP